MACYRISYYIGEDQIDAVMAWLEENRQPLGLIRGSALKTTRGPNCSEELWLSKFVFKTDEGARMYCRRWLPDFREDAKIEPWR